MRGRRTGFSLVEALLAITLTTTAGGALLTAIASTVQSSSEQVDVIVARGLSQQLMDEVAAVKINNGTAIRPNGVPRAQFDELDDFHGWTSQPPVDRHGCPIGTEGNVAGLSDRPISLRPEAGRLDRLKQSITVERVVPGSGDVWNVVSLATNYRRVTVRITRTSAQGSEQVLSELTRIVSYVVPAP